MSKGKSQELREVAEGVVAKIGDEHGIPEYRRTDLVTSLVRQWLTYDRNAVLLLGENAVRIVLDATPLGKPRVNLSLTLPLWLRQTVRDWKIDPDDLPEAVHQLNCGQSAEVVNGDGVALRLWLDPRNAGAGVKPLVAHEVRRLPKQDLYFKMARDELEKRLGKLDREELEALAASVARQWEGYEGHACIFRDAHRQLVLQCVESSDGRCTIASQEKTLEIGRLLVSWDVAADALGKAVAKINLGQELEVRDREGVRHRLWFDPRLMGIRSRPLAPVPPPPPIFCPQCTAVLKAWQHGQREQTCPLCGHVVAIHSSTVPGNAEK